jgi:hypothetical protein
MRHHSLNDRVQRRKRARWQRYLLAAVIALAGIVAGIHTIDSSHSRPPVASVRWQVIQAGGELEAASAPPQPGSVRWQ